MKRKAIIVDIDGTIAEKYFWRNYYEYDKVELDTPIQWVIDIIELFSYYQPSLEIIFLTGRKEGSRKVTREWIKKNTIIQDFLLLMRPDDDKRLDYVVKKEIYLRDIEPEYEVIAVFEDGRRNVEMFRELGLLTFQHVEWDY